MADSTAEATNRAVQRPHDAAAAAQPDEERADHRGHDAGRADRQRQHHRRGLRLPREEDRAQYHGRHHRNRIGLEQVGGHAGAVAHVVAHVVGDDGGVARVVLGDPGLNLPHKVGADVRALGEDAAAQAGEDRDQRSAEPQGDQGSDDLAHLQAQVEQNGVVDGHGEQRETGHQHPGDGPGLERDAQPVRQAPGCGLGRAHVRAHRHVHADVSGRTGQHRADHEPDAGAPVEPQPGQHEDDRADDGDGRVLTVEVGAGAFLDRRGDFTHAGRAGIADQHRAARVDGIQDGEQTAGDHQPVHGRHGFSWRGVGRAGAPRLAARGYARPGRATQRAPRRRTALRAAPVASVGGDSEPRLACNASTP